ncbi:MAG: DUF1015 family protein [Chitinivibrionales bacterium]|nr:DUF1015 family protein [Chitinivibrionales bacterium]
MATSQQRRSLVIEIKPFRGYRYKLTDADELEHSVAPPYDMINSETARELSAANPHNAVHIIQNPQQPSDAANRDRHRRATKLLNSWIEQDILTRDPAPCIYVYEQTFRMQNAQQTRTGVIVRVRLTDFSEGSVQPHERTLSAPKTDRYELLEESRFNTGQIFSVVSDTGGVFDAIKACREGAPVGRFTDADGVLHRLYKTCDEMKIADLAQNVHDQSLLIADGHHRYETALQFAQTTGNPAHAGVMMTLVSMADPGLVIRPFHRMAKRTEKSAPDNPLGALQAYFSCKRLGEPADRCIEEFLSMRDNRDMLFYDTKQSSLYALSLNDQGRRLLDTVDNGMSPEWNYLNVSLINTIYVGKILGLPLDGTTLHDVMEYENDYRRALKVAADPSVFTGVFFIRPLNIEAIRSIVAKGERMPQKSTNFFPKCYSGLVFNSLENS